MADDSDDEDVLVMGPILDQDLRPFCRKNSEGIHTGIMRPVKEGESLGQNSFMVEHQGPGPLYKVHPIFEKPSQEGVSRSRPATREYLAGWDRIFGGQKVVGEA
jgi:hypothetical protein